MKLKQIVLGLTVIAIVIGAYSMFQLLEEQEPKIRLAEVKTPADSDAAKVRNAPTDAKNVAIKFGFDLRASPEEDARQYLPFLNYLKRETGYDFELRFTGEDCQYRSKNRPVCWRKTPPVAYDLTRAPIGALVRSYGCC